MSKIVIHMRPTIPWHKRWVKFFVTGFKKHGIDVVVSSSAQVTRGCDIAILFGPNMWKAIESSGVSYLMVNRKFFGVEEHVAGDIVAMGWNGFNGPATFCVEDVSPDRLRKFLDPEKEIQEWKSGGTNILICGQADLGRCTSYSNLEKWYNQVKITVNSLVKFRSHPTRKKLIPLDEELENVKVAITLNSLVAIEILMAGIPVISMDENSPVYGVTGHSLNDIKYPNRLELFQYLAHCQWYYTEIESGKFWEQLYPKRGLPLKEYAQ